MRLSDSDSLWFWGFVVVSTWQLNGKQFHPQVCAAASWPPHRWRQFKERLELILEVELALISVIFLKIVLQRNPEPGTQQNIPSASAPSVAQGGWDDASFPRPMSRVHDRKPVIIMLIVLYKLLFLKQLQEIPPLNQRTTYLKATASVFALITLYWLLSMKLKSVFGLFKL